MGEATEYERPVPANQHAAASHNMEHPVQYEYSNEPEEDKDEDGEVEDGDSEAAAAAGGDGSYVNELVLQRSRNRHPAFTDEQHQRTTTWTLQTPSMHATNHPCQWLEHKFGHMNC